MPPRTQVRSSMLRGCVVAHDDNTAAMKPPMIALIIRFNLELFMMVPLDLFFYLFQDMKFHDIAVLQYEIPLDRLAVEFA